MEAQENTRKQTKHVVCSMKLSDRKKLKKGRKKLKNLGRHKLKIDNFNSTECKTKIAKGQEGKKARQGEQRTHFRRPGLNLRDQRAEKCKYRIFKNQNNICILFGKSSLMTDQKWEEFMGRNHS